MSHRQLGGLWEHPLNKHTVSGKGLWENNKQCSLLAQRTQKEKPSPTMPFCFLREFREKLSLARHPRHQRRVLQECRQALGSRVGGVLPLHRGSFVQARWIRTSLLSPHPTSHLAGNCSLLLASVREEKIQPAVTVQDRGSSLWPLERQKLLQDPPALVGTTSICIGPVGIGFMGVHTCF